MVERVKGGVKLFVGRLPLEASQDMLYNCFKEYGEVLEVFLIDSVRANTGARCAFVRMAVLEDAERCIEEMHERRVLVKDRAELGPIQVAFAKGETARFGLNPEKETLPARWQTGGPGGGGGGGHGGGGPSHADPDSFSKEAFVNLVKEGQRTGGPTFKNHWWAYCDSGKGGVTDYDPKRHSRGSLRTFYITAQNSELAHKPWFRRAVNWCLMGGRRGGGRGRSSSSGSRSRSSSSKSRSSSHSSSRRRRSLRRKAELLKQGAPAPAPCGAAPLAASTVSPGGPQQRPSGLPAARGAAPSLGELLRAQPPAPEAHPPPEPDSRAVASKPSRLLAPATDRDVELEEFLHRHKISPATSFLMLKLTKEQARKAMTNVNDFIARRASERRTVEPKEVELAVVQEMKKMGAQTNSGSAGCWISTERAAGAASPVVVRPGAGYGPPVLPRYGGDTLPSSPPAPSTSHAGPEEESPPPPEPQASEAPEAPPPPPPPPARLRTPSPPPTPPPAEEEVPKVLAAAPPGAKVFVKNLGKETKEDALRELFGQHGTVLDVHLPRERETGLAKGHAHIAMSSRSEAEKSAKALNFTKPFGRALVVERIVDPDEKEAPKQEEPPAQPKRDRSVDRSRSRDKDRDREASVRDGEVSKRPRPDGLRKRSRSRSDAKSSGSESGWSRYTVGSKGKRKDKSKPREKERRKPPERRKRSRSSSKASSAKGAGKASSSSSSSEGERSEDSKSRKRREGPPMGWPSGAPPFPMPGMPPGMMPPPWAMPWGMPGLPPPPMRDENGYVAYDREEAEKLLRRAEKKAQKDHPERRGEDGKGKEVWEDHPARMAQRRRSESRDSVSKSKSPKRPKAKRSSSRPQSSRPSSGRRKRSAKPRRERGPRRGSPSKPPRGTPGTIWRPHVPPMGPPPHMVPPGWPGMPPFMPPMGPPGGPPMPYPGPRPHMAPQQKAAPAASVENVASDDSDEDAGKVEDINFADI